MIPPTTKKVAYEGGEKNKIKNITLSERIRLTKIWIKKLQNENITARIFAVLLLSFLKAFVKRKNIKTRGANRPMLKIIKKPPKPKLTIPPFQR